MKKENTKKSQTAKKSNVIFNKNMIHLVSDKTDKKAVKKQAQEDIKVLNIKIFAEVNADMQALKDNPVFEGKTRLQKLAYLRSTYDGSHDEFFGIVMTIRELNLTIPNDLSASAYRLIFKGIKENWVTKSKVNKADDEQLKSILKDLRSKAQK